MIRFPFHSSTAVAAMIAVATAALILAPSSLTGADEEKKPRGRKSPIKLAAVTPGASPAATGGTVDLSSLPNFDFDPDVPEHLRPVRLYSTDGRFVDARLLSVSPDGEQVSVQRVSDERSFDIPLKSLDAASVARVETWMDRGPITKEYSIDFDVKRRLVDMDSFSTVGRNFKLYQWAYDVKLTNQTREELRDAELEYQIFYDDEVQVVRTSAYPGVGEKQREANGVELPALEYNGRAEFTTPAVELQTYEYEPTRGEREFRRDEMVGIWIRIFRNGEVIAEHRSHPAAMMELPWDEKEKFDIVVRDSFRDQFENDKKIGD